MPGMNLLVAVWSGRGGFALTVSWAGGNAPGAGPGGMLLQRLERAVGRQALDTVGGCLARGREAGERGPVAAGRGRDWLERRAG
jgi:hypothetical protein